MARPALSRTGLAAALAGLLALVVRRRQAQRSEREVWHEATTRADLR